MRWSCCDPQQKLRGIQAGWWARPMGQELLGCTEGPRRREHTWHAFSSNKRGTCDDGRATL